MDQNSLSFWEHHSVHFLEMVFEMGKRERLDNADGYGKAVRECGDTVEIFLTVRDGRIRTASFEVDGCLYSVACANTVVHLTEGKTLHEALSLTPEEVVSYLETLPMEEAHCAEQAVKALHLAVLDAKSLDRNPWKKLYRKH